MDGMDDAHPWPSVWGRTYNVVIAFPAESCRVWHGAIHNPSLRVVLCADKVLYLAGLVSVGYGGWSWEQTHVSGGAWPGASLASQYLCFRQHVANAGDGGQWTVDSGQWIVDSGQWIVDSG